jgi:hypothetical protein
MSSAIKLLAYCAKPHSSFDFCAECLSSFISDNLGRTPEDGVLPLGFTVGHAV